MNVTRSIVNLMAAAFTAGWFVEWCNLFQLSSWLSRGNYPRFSQFYASSSVFSMPQTKFNSLNCWNNEHFKPTTISPSLGFQKWIPHFSLLLQKNTRGKPSSSLNVFRETVTEWYWLIKKRHKHSWSPGKASSGMSLSFPIIVNP